MGGFEADTTVEATTVAVLVDRAVTGKDDSDAGVG